MKTHTASNQQLFARVARLFSESRGAKGRFNCLFKILPFFVWNAFSGLKCGVRVNWFKLIAVRQESVNLLHCVRSLAAKRFGWSAVRMRSVDSVRASRDWIFDSRFSQNCNHCQTKRLINCSLFLSNCFDNAHSDCSYFVWNQSLLFENLFRNHSGILSFTIIQPAGLSSFKTSDEDLEGPKIGKSGN